MDLAQASGPYYSPFMCECSVLPVLEWS